MLTNACRMDPIGFRDQHVGSYNILNAYPKVAPIRWNLSLNQSARFHADEMASVSGCAFSHNSCDGTSFSNRVKSYYAASSWIGENIAAGYSDPLGTIQQWILDDVGNGPAADNSGSDGHRKNIMNSVYQELGVGYASGPNRYTYFWVQDFGGGAGADSSPVVGGTHLFLETGKTTFMASYYDASGKAPTEASLFLDQNTYTMALYLGTASQGTYSYITAKGTLCHTYAFRFKDGSGKIWTYPQNGRLATIGEGSCTQEYVATEVSALRRSLPDRPTIRYIGGALPSIELSTMIDLSQLHILDLHGRLVASLPVSAGANRISLPARTFLPSGLYFCTISAGGRNPTVFHLMIP